MTMKRMFAAYDAAVFAIERQRILKTLASADPLGAYRHPYLEIDATETLSQCAVRLGCCALACSVRARQPKPHHAPIAWIDAWLGHPLDTIVENYEEIAGAVLDYVLGYHIYTP